MSKIYSTAILLVAIPFFLVASPSFKDEPILSKGYYIVANVFASDENARKFQNFLGTKSLDTKSFINPINKYKYIYLDKVATENEAISLYLSKFNGLYQDRLWILSVNNSSVIIANED